MIKFAVTRPDQRMKDIQTGINKLNWTGDKMLQAYGLSINPNMIEVTFPSARRYLRGGGGGGGGGMH